MSQFKMTKFHFTNPEASMLLQKAMFKLGFMWCNKRSGDVRKTVDIAYTSGFIYVDRDCRMSYSSTDYGLRHHNTSHATMLPSTLFAAADRHHEAKKAERKASRKREAERRLGSFIPWTGGECPVAAGTLVDVKFRSAGTKYGIPARVESPGACANDRFWQNDRHGSDIVAYRLSAVEKQVEAPYIPWAGGEMPVPKGTIVDVKYRISRMGAKTAEGVVAGESMGATSQYWLDEDMGNDIVGYRVVSLKVGSLADLTVPVGDLVVGSLRATDPALDPSANPKHAIGNTALPMTMPSPLFRAMVALGKANGAGKYGGANYIGTPVVMSTYLNAIQRHLDKIIMGEEADEIDGVPHWGAIGANIDIIVSAQAAGSLIDDRLRADGQLAAVKALTPLVASLATLHKERTPQHFYMKDKA